MPARAIVVFAAIFCLAGYAGAAQITELGPGGKLDGQVPGQLPVDLTAGQTVEGPAVITAADGSVARLRAESSLRLLPPTEDGREDLFLISGTVSGEIGGRTDLVLMVGRLVGPKEGHSSVYAEMKGRDAAVFKVNEGKALVVQGPSPFPAHHFLLGAGQSVLLKRVPNQADAVEFDTLPYNTNLLVIIARVTTPLEIVLAAPRATIAKIEQIDNGARTKVTTDKGSQGGQMEIVTFRDGVQHQTGRLGPGTFAIIDNLTGEISYEEEEVDYGAVARTVSLTSEFQALALSNFNTIKPK